MILKGINTLFGNEDLFMKVRLTNAGGVTKEVKVGFSWTTFFFGFIPALFRGDLKWAVIIILLEIALGSFTFGFGTGIVTIIFGFIYNKLHIKDLIEKGYKPSTERDHELLVEKDIIS